MGGHIMKTTMEIADDLFERVQRIAVVGASNGTTTALDFAVYASTDPKVPFPSALVFLTGGTYTLSGTIGQPDASTASVGTYTATGGFWASVQDIFNMFLPLIRKP